MLSGESRLRVQCFQAFKVTTRREIVLLYGGFLVLTASRNAPALKSELEDQLIVLKHIHNDA